MEIDEKKDGNVKPVIDYSSISGKRVLVSPTNEQYDLLKKLLETRITESGGETIFDIGIGDGEEYNGIDADEYAASLATLQSLATTLNADCVELRQRPSEKGMTGQYLIRKRVDQSDFMEIRYVFLIGKYFMKFSLTMKCFFF